MYRVRLAFVLAVATAGCLMMSTAPRAQERELTVVATGGAFGNALKTSFYTPFKKVSGVQMRAVSATNSETWAKLKAMQQTGDVEWDLVTAWPEDLIAQRALLDPIDCGQLASLAGQAVDGACQPYGLLRTMGGVNLVYDPAKFPNGGPRTWADFWDVKKFPGPRALPNAGAPWWPLMAALQADGVPKDKLFPLDLDRAFRKLDEIRPNVAMWWRTGDQSAQMFRSGEVAVAMMWSGNAYLLDQQGMKLDVEWDGAVPNTAYWALVHGSKHRAEAMAFLDFFLTRPDAHLSFSRLFNFDTSNRNVLSLLTPDDRKTRVLAPDNTALLAPIDATWVAENRAMVLERWNRWLAQ